MLIFLKGRNNSYLGRKSDLVWATRLKFFPEVYLVKTNHYGIFQIERTNQSEKSFLIGGGGGLSLDLTSILQILKLIIFQCFVCHFVAHEILHRMVYDSGRFIWLGQNTISQKSEKVSFLIENHDIFTRIQQILNEPFSSSNSTEISVR